MLTRVPEIIKVFLNFLFRRTSRGADQVNKGRESVNSFDDFSVRNSQSRTTDSKKPPKLSYLSTSLNVTNDLNTSATHNNSVTISNKATNSNNLMSSTDTISRNQRETLHSRFDFIKVLGKGTYGKVKLANDKRTGKQVIF